MLFRSAAQYKANAETNMQKTLAQYVPNDKVFENVGVLEISNNLGLPSEEIARILSDDTAVLDHCIAQGGSAAEGTINPWAPEKGRKGYEPIYDPATGQRNPKASRDTSSYISAVKNGDQLVSFRDTATGLPKATFQFHLNDVDASGMPNYTIGYASGWKNGAVDPAFVDGIKSYLNSRQENIQIGRAHV